MAKIEQNFIRENSSMCLSSDYNQRKDKIKVSARELGAAFSVLLDAIESRLERSKALQASDLVFELRRFLEK